MTKKLLALLLSLCMMLSLAACGGSDELSQKALAGRWDLTVDYSKIADQMDMSDFPAELGTDVLKDLQMTVTMDFDGKDTVTMMLSTESFNDLMGKFIDSYMEYLSNGGIYEMLAAEAGVSAQYIEENFEAMVGMDANTYLALMKGMMSSMDFSELIAADGDAEIKDGYMIMSEGSYKLEGNNITIVDSEDGAESTMTVEYDSSKKTMEIVDYASDEEGEVSDALIGCIMRKQ